MLAARKLFTYCRAGEAVRRAVVAGGGVHMLLIMLDSVDNTVRDLCTRTLTDLAADDGVRCGQGGQRWRGSQDRACRARAGLTLVGEASLQAVCQGSKRLKPND